MPCLTAFFPQKAWRLAAALLVAVLAAAQPALAQQRLFPADSLPKRPAFQPLNPKGEFLLRADEVVFDRAQDAFMARGNVEISQGDRLLLADLIAYERKAETVSASGNVVLVDPSGDVTFADRAEISDDLRNGVISNFRALLVDNSRMAAVTAQRIDGNRTLLNKGVFSPCNLCKDNPTKAPLWQLKGARVIHNQERREIVYRDMSLELGGVPVFYTPYFSHPDPSVDRRSGVLTPTLRRSDQLGAIVGLPYYGIVDDSSDFTLEPRIYSSEGGLLAGEFRRRFNHGFVRLTGSVLNGRNFDGNADARSWRGNFASEGRFDLSESWRTGFDLNRVTDRTYLRRFKIERDYRSHGRYALPDQLTSAGWIENFTERSYFNASTFAFQSLRADISSRFLPTLHPYAQYQSFSPSDAIGGRFQIDSNFLSLSRQKGVQATRLSTITGYYLPYIGRWGDVWEASTTLQGDLYAVQDLPLPSAANGLYDGTVTRLHPQFAVNVRYPLIRRQESFSLLLEPRLGLVVGPNGNNPSTIPNLDSQIFEFDETRLFSSRPMSGYDRIASGSRIDYALSGGVYGSKGESASFILGQSIRNSNMPIYPANSGFNDEVSDIVGRLSLQPKQWLDLSYRFRLDHASHTFSRQELSSTFFHKGSALSVSYIDYKRDLVSANNHNAEALVLSGVASLNNVWTLYGSYHRDLERNQNRTLRFGTIYRDECFALMLGLERDYLFDRDVRPETSFMVRVGLKYLGDFGG